jgi:catechol 2,3-dioxygenase-like lactoylglutathione lyase family enzyme
MDSGTPRVRPRRLGHLELETPDLHREAEHYRDVIGLAEIHRDGKEIHFATRVGQLAVVLRRGAHARCTGIALELGGDASLAEARSELQTLGLESQMLHDRLPSIGEALAFSDPNGMRITLFREWDFLPVPRSGGCAPIKLGHVAIMVSDPQDMAEFYGRMLGFREADWVGEHFVFLRCGPDHHTVNFVRGPDRRMHHCAFEMQDRAHLLDSCDLLGREGIEIIWGPVRHGPGHNIATYHLTPDRQMIELFTELDRMSDLDQGYYDPKPWHDDQPQRPKRWTPGPSRGVWGPGMPPDFFRILPR